MELHQSMESICSAEEATELVNFRSQPQFKLSKFKKVLSEFFSTNPWKIRIQLGRKEKYTAAEVAFSIDHIMEEIHSFLGPRELLQCRRVSHRWEFFSRTQIQNRNFMLFRFNGDSITYFDLADGRKLSKLIFLCSIRHKKFLSGAFPITEFTFDGGYLSDPTLQKFLNIQGHFITKFSHFGPNHMLCGYNLVHENVVLEYVSNLIGKQIPNLQYFRMALSTVNDKTVFPILCEETEKKSDSVQNYNLKVFDFRNSTSEKIFETVLKLAPNLEEILVQTENLAFLTKSPNRICFLKTLGFFAPDFGVQKMVNGGIQKLRLRSIWICFGSEMVYRGWARHEGPVGCILTKLLETCSSSLETIGWNPVTKLKTFVWPKILPNMRKICLQCQPEGSDVSNFFPNGVILGSMFPHLKVIRLYANQTRKDLIPLQCCFNVNPDYSVGSVEIFCLYFQRKNLLKEDELLFQQIFPNANLAVKYYPAGW